MRASFRFFPFPHCSIRTPYLALDYLLCFSYYFLLFNPLVLLGFPSAGLPPKIRQGRSFLFDLSFYPFLTTFVDYTLGTLSPCSVGRRSSVSVSLLYLCFGYCCMLWPLLPSFLPCLRVAFSLKPPFHSLSHFSFFSSPVLSLLLLALKCYQVVNHCGYKDTLQYYPDRKSVV